MASTHEEVADKIGLNPGVRRDYLRYMRTRWGSEEANHCLTGYADEWARRFFSGHEYGASDWEGQQLLTRMLTES